MTNFIVIFISFFLGMSLKHIERFPRSTSLSINLFVIYVSLPALILTKFPPLFTTLELNGNWWVPISMAWITFFLSWIFISLIGKKLHWSRAKMGALILTCGLGNTSFVGFPILEAILGKSAIPIGILADQPGSFLIVSSIGILVAAQYSGAQTSINYILKKVFTFPPFLTLLLAVLWAILKMPGKEFINEPVEKISLTLVPLSLFAVGFQTDFRWNVIKKRLPSLAMGLCFKLVFLPFFFFLLFVKFMNIHDSFSQIAILESAMATQITSAVVVQEFNLDTELANLMVGLSIPISILTVPFLNKLLF